MVALCGNFESSADRIQSLWVAAKPEAPPAANKPEAPPAANKPEAPPAANKPELAAQAHLGARSPVAAQAHLGARSPVAAQAHLGARSPVAAQAHLGARSPVAAQAHPGAPFSGEALHSPSAGTSPSHGSPQRQRRSRSRSRSGRRNRDSAHSPQRRSTHSSERHSNARADRSPVKGRHSQRRSRSRSQSRGVKQGDQGAVTPWIHGTLVARLGEWLIFPQRKKQDSVGTRVTYKQQYQDDPSRPPEDGAHVVFVAQLSSELGLGNNAYKYTAVRVTVVERYML
jgi:hypothetical protein